MTPEYFKRIMIRDLTTVRQEIQAYPTDAALWELPQGIQNAAGTLVLHLAGNLQHFVGRQLGGTDYVRKRDAEFADRGISRADLVALIDRTMTALGRTLDRLPQDRLADMYPEALGGVQLPTGLFLLHLSTHLAYHLGQIDTHRRLVTHDLQGVGAQGIPVLGQACVVP